MTDMGIYHQLWPLAIESRSKIRRMKAFHSGREAKEFLISEVVEEAQHQNVTLSEVERKMLYFTESGWTLPDIVKVNEDFDSEYDQDEYEQKIAKLVKEADRRIRKAAGDDYEKWWGAIRFLQREDHYISVMIRLAGLRPRGDQLRLFVAALGIVSVIAVWGFLSAKYNLTALSRENLEMFAGGFGACLFLVYILVALVVGKKRADDLTFTAAEKFVRFYKRVTGNA
jgi:hypothetical protein